MYVEHDEGTSNCSTSFLGLEPDEPSALGLSQTHLFFVVFLPAFEKHTPIYVRIKMFSGNV